MRIEAIASDVFGGQVRVHAQIHLGLDVALPDVAAQRAHRVLDHLDVQVVADRRHVPRLLGAQQVARAPDLQVAHRDAKARAKLGKFADRVQALVCRLGEHLAGADGQKRVG
ncbi:MAG: hypothetical protein RR843_12440, partial [Clostridia bacterium]